MSKEITIDGVDVSECKFVLNCRCEQLKVKEQECERLKLDLIEAKAHGDYLNNLALSKTLDTVSGELDQLKAGIDELKNGYSRLNSLYNDNCDYTGKLEQTLIEIKEIVNKNYKTKEERSKIRHGRLPKFSMGALYGRHGLASEILQKVREVIPDEN